MTIDWTMPRPVGAEYHRHLRGSPCARVPGMGPRRRTGGCRPGREPHRVGFTLAGITNSSSLSNEISAFAPFDGVPMKTA